MKRTVMAIAWMVVCAFLVSAAAQTQPPTEQQRPQAQAEEKTVTLTGCLAAGDQPNTFKLTNIGVAEKTAPRPGEPVGTSGIKAGEALRLIGADAEKIKAHVGHTVAVTGMIVPQKESPAAAPPTSARPMQERADVRLNVTSFKHVDAACPPAAK